MDPKTAILDLLQYIDDRDMDSAAEKLEEIAAWIDRGGFLPHNAIYAAREALRSTEG